MESLNLIVFIISIIFFFLPLYLSLLFADHCQHRSYLFILFGCLFLRYTIVVVFTDILNIYIFSEYCAVVYNARIGAIKVLSQWAFH